MIIPFFIMNRGCPHRCLFCNERLTAGDHGERIEKRTFVETVRAHLGHRRREKLPSQIAFYGGTFTGMDQNEQIRLLDLAEPFLKEGTIAGIRISTRPDEITAEGLDLLRDHGVTTVEVGVQSLSDEILFLSERGHTAADCDRAISLLKAMGFKTGIHLMVGLPGDSEERFAETIDKTVALHPDMVRIHPTIVLRDTLLAKAFREERYRPLTLEEAVRQSKNALKRLTAARIAVIRLGLQTTRELEEPGAVVAGPFHPAFRSLVESSLFLEVAMDLLTTAKINGGHATFAVAPADVSYFYGHRRINVDSLKIRHNVNEIRLVVTPALSRRELVLTTGEKSFKADSYGNISTVPTEDLHADL
jgi:histone acetyltransferase (RNA polymerase elongator complex component)